MLVIAAAVLITVLTTSALVLLALKVLGGSSVAEARREAETIRREAGIEAREEAVRLRSEVELEELERIAGMTVNDAKARLLAQSEELIRHDLARRVRLLDEEAQSEAKRRARNLVADALQRVAASHAAETTSSLIELPSDDMKGR